MRVRILALKLLKCIETRSYFVFQSSLKEKKHKYQPRIFAD